MSQTPEWPPTPEAMHSLLPAFGFTSMVTSNDHGAVFFANQKSLDRQVAVKVFSPALGVDSTFRVAFENSSKLAAGLRHTNLIGILDSGRAGAMPYLVMEFVPGKSLARSTRGRLLEFGQSLSIIEGICDGLAHAHEAGLVHGHLDTLSVLLNQHAVPKIGNFGLGRIVHTDPDAKPPRHFTAPEVHVDPAAATKASDVFSVAAIFHELITGQPYAPGSPPASILCGCRPAIDAVLKQATDPDPGKRHADAAAFQSALKKAAEAPRQVVAAAAAPATPATPAASLPAPKSGFDSKLLTKLVIIVVLLFAILFTWETLKKNRAERENENREMLAKQQAAAALIAEQKAMQQARANLVRPDPATEAPRFEPEPETPAQSLSRLRTPLAAGARGEMPLGSVKKGDRFYFPVETPMSWFEAAFFAEEHGAHLAGPDTDSAFPAEELTKGRECWLGAARSGDDSWVLCHGKAWNPSVQPGGDGLFLISAKNGGFASADEGQALPFVIVWYADGSNPGTLAAQLAATRASLDSASPVFPPGTVVAGERRYFFVPRPVSWEEASEMAQDGGGHLLVAAAAAEITEVEEFAKRLDARDGIWLGGSLEDDYWKWITGEPWQAAAWADESTASEEGAALAIRPGKGWFAMDRGDTASGFLIEWSADKDSGKPGSPAPAVGSQASEFNARAKELVLAAVKKRDEDFAANVKKFRWDLDSFFRNLNRSNQNLFGSSVEYLKAAVEADRLLVEEIKDNWRQERITVSPEMEKLLNYHSGKEAEIDAKFLADTGRIRDAYVAKLTTIRDEAKAAGQAKIAADTDETIGETEDLKAWLKSFGVSFPEVKPPEIRNGDFDRDTDDDSDEERRRRFRERFRDESEDRD